MFERLYDVSEHASLNYVGYMTDTTRYDFAIVYTGHFYGKPLVVCMQTGRSATLCSDDLSRLDILQRMYNLSDELEARRLADLLEDHIEPVCSREES